MKKSFLALWLLLGIFFIFFWIYLPSLSKYRDLKTTQEDIDRQVRDIAVNIQALKEERELLKSDVAYLEKVIRDELGLVKPGEIVYKFVEDPAQPPKVTGHDSMPQLSSGKDGEAASQPSIQPPKPAAASAQAAASAVQ